MHWKLVFDSILESIYHHWKETGDKNVESQVIDAFELQDQSETDEVDLEHYLDTIGA